MGLTKLMMTRSTDSFQALLAYFPLMSFGRLASAAAVQGDAQPGCCPLVIHVDSLAAGWAAAGWDHRNLRVVTQAQQQ